MTAELGIKKSDSWKLFNRISKRYDIVNNVLTLGIVFYWRKQLVKHFPIQTLTHVYDLATGTGEVLLSIMNTHHSRISKITGLDLAKEMILIAEEKRNRKTYKGKVDFVVASAQDIPEKDNSIDAVSMAFGIRNVPDAQACLDEIYRVLKPGAQVFIMEFGLPKNRLLKKLYLLYFRYLLPSISGLISGDKKAYNYLNKSVEQFPYAKEFEGMMQKSGFKVNYIAFTFGINYLYIGTK
jgi:demethylmenaquinone methyltransferase/2-methoxy-6-polyprenyl-1,4-benzoquinol methylase